MSLRLAPCSPDAKPFWFQSKADSGCLRCLPRRAEILTSRSCKLFFPAFTCIALRRALFSRSRQSKLGRTAALSADSSGRSGRNVYANAWYPLCFTRTTDRTRPHTAYVCGAPVVFWQDATNTWRALLDECPHRAARLSEGRVKDNGHIECPYHGWSFDGETGNCSAIPQALASDDVDDPAKNPRACASKLVTAERRGILFVWAAPLYGSDAAADVHGLDELTHSDIFDTPGVQYVDYSRDLPMDLPVLLENVLDPSHLPFTHHDTISNRNKASPVPIKMRGPPKVTGFKGDRFTSAPGAVEFIAPNHVIAVTDRKESFRDWNIVYATPSRPGRCRIFVRVVFEVSKIPLPLRFVFQYAFSPSVPAFFTHLSNHRVLEDDNIFLHYQGRSLAPGGIQDANWRKRIYVPTSSDAAVVHYRCWLEEFAEGGVSWVRDWPFYLPEERSELLERFHSHTEHCESCAGALASARRFIDLADLAVLAAVLAAVLLDGWRWPAAAGALAVAALKAFAKDVEAKLVMGEYPPPRNRPSFDFMDLLQQGSR